MKKTIIIPAILCTLIIGCTSKTIDIEKEPTHATITAVNLLDAFESDEEVANENYSSKVLEVKGSLKDVQSISDSDLRITLEAESTMGSIVCNMQAQHKVALERLKIGDVINVKGMCTGYMFDVVLDETIIIN